MATREAAPCPQGCSTCFGKGARRDLDLPVLQSRNLPRRGINRARHFRFWVYSGRMSDDETPPQPIAPLFSVIIPLEFHRGQWGRAWQGWQSQTLDRAGFEIILVVPPDFPDRDKLAELGDLARLEYSHHSHDIGLCAAGAAKARGKFLFFTESHCWPEPDVLELCLQAFHAIRTGPDFPASRYASVTTDCLKSKQTCMRPIPNSA